MDATFGKILKIIIAIAIIFVIGWLIILLKSILILLAISAIIAYILDPFASYLEFRGFTRLQATIMIFFTFAGLAGVLLYLLTPSLLNELTYLQQGLGGSKGSELVAKLEKAIHDNIPMLQGQELHLYDKMQGLFSGFTEQFFSIVVDVVSIVSSAIIIPFAVFFILKDGRTLKKNLFAMVPNKYFEMSLNLFHKVDLQLGGYLRGQFLDAVIIGLLSIIALWILDVKYYVLIGIFAGLANMIPYVGPLSGMIVATLVVLMNDGSGHNVALVIVAFAIIQLIDNVLVQPLVLGKSVNLHPLVIIFAIITGSQFFGIIGMLVAIPVTGILKVIIMEVYQAIKRFNVI